jgi:hypothetical protein
LRKTYWRLRFSYLIYSEIQDLEIRRGRMGLNLPEEGALIVIISPVIIGKQIRL